MWVCAPLRLLAGHSVSLLLLSPGDVRTQKPFDQITSSDPNYDKLHATLRDTGVWTNLAEDYTSAREILARFVVTKNSWCRCGRDRRLSW